jgi:glycosyltransferase involved in cell wall biosynthesis
MSQSFVARQASLRILHVVPTYLPAVRYGGPIRSVHALARALAQRGHEVHVFTSSMDGPEDLDVPLRTATSLDGVLVQYFPVPFARRLCWCPDMLRALRSEMPAFDVVHLHSVFLWPTYAAARIAKSAAVPYLVAPRGMLGTTVIRRKSRLVKSAWIRLVEQRTIAQAAGLHLTSDVEIADVRELGLQLPKVHCVPNGLDWPSSHSPLAAGPFADLPRPYVLFLSRIDRKKGLDRLLQAWKRVEGEITLVIAGNDEEGYREELERVAIAERISERIRFIGAVADEHKWALYENALLFVLPSYSENFGNTVAEAMAMGCPVAITPEVGLARFVTDHCAGVVSEGEPTVFARAIESLVRDPALRATMGARGRVAAREFLSCAAVAQQMESVYRSVISESAAPRAALPPAMAG